MVTTPDPAGSWETYVRCSIKKDVKKARTNILVEFLQKMRDPLGGIQKELFDRWLSMPRSLSVLPVGRRTAAQATTERINNIVEQMEGIQDEPEVNISLDNPDPELNYERRWRLAWQQIGAVKRMIELIEKLTHCVQKEAYIHKEMTVVAYLDVIRAEWYLEMCKIIKAAGDDAPFWQPYLEHFLPKHAHSIVMPERVRDAGHESIPEQRHALPREPDCPICTTAFKESDRKSRSKHPVCCSSCGHGYHNDCLMEWLSQPGDTKTCPMCRTAMPEHLLIQYLNTKTSKIWRDIGLGRY
jgi:hypothetical protein